MCEIFFYDKQRKPIIIFSDFSFTKSEIINISFKCIVSFDFFQVQSVFKAENYDFVRFEKGICEMHSERQKYAAFNHLSNNISILFAAESTGISVSVSISNNIFTGELSFRYVIDQSFLPELSKEISEIIKASSEGK